MRCKKCGTDNPDGASYCRNCGYEMSAIRKSSASSDTYKDDKTASYGSRGETGYDRGGYTAGGGFESDDYGRGGYDRGTTGRAGYVDSRTSSRTPSASDVPAGYSAEPLSMWAYMGLSVLFGIPMAGFICLIVFSCGAVKNINLVNFARGLLLLQIIVMVLGFLLAYAFGLSLGSLLNGITQSYY